MNESREITSVTRVSSETCVFNWKIENILSWYDISNCEGFSSIESCAFTSIIKQGYVVWKLTAKRDNMDKNEITFHLLRNVVAPNIFKQVICGEFALLKLKGPESTWKFVRVFEDVTHDRIKLMSFSFSSLYRYFIYNADLSVRLEMSVLESPGFVLNIPARFTAKPELKPRQKYFQLLFDTQRFCDLIISCEGKQFRVHKSILASCSPVLDAMLSHSMPKKNSNSIHITDLNSRAVQTMLRYMYTAEVTLSTPEETLNLYIAACKYQVPDLMQKCAEYFASNLTPLIVIDVLFLACLYRDDILEEVAIDFIVPSHSCILHSSEWKNFTKQFPLCASKILVKMSLLS